MAISRWSPWDLLLSNTKLIARKMGVIAVGWALVYFLTQRMRVVPADGGVNFLTLFGPLVGAVAGLLAGWYLAFNAVEDMSLNGMTLWVILVLAGVLPMWGMEGILGAITHWPINFGGWMIVSAGNLMALASSVWYASSQE